MSNILLMTDSYKGSHAPQYPKGTTKIISYLESRGGMFDNTVFIGNQINMKKYLVGKQVTKKKILKAQKFWNAHFGFEIFDDKAVARWMHIVNKYNGYLPVEIRAVREGEVVPTKNVLLVIESTDPECFWLVNFLETLILKVWYPTTVATLSRECKKVILEYLRETGTPDLIDYKLIDFGYRGVSSEESAGIGGTAHLVNFKVSDNVKGIRYAQKYYNTTEMLGFGIPASEHSTITSWLKSGEVDAYRNLLEIYKDAPLLANVSDSYDILNAIDIYGSELKVEITSRQGTFIIRLDSGDPIQTILACLNKLGDNFGYTTNNLGYKVLDAHVRILQGDGINYYSIRNILEAMKNSEWSADNISFGMGGKLLQGVDRDTQNFAIKCCLAIVNGEVREVVKSPLEILADGSRKQSFKTSKKGYLYLIKNHLNQFETIESPTINLLLEENNLLIPVFRNGEILKEYTFEEVRENAKL